MFPAGLAPLPLYVWWIIINIFTATHPWKFTVPAAHFYSPCLSLSHIAATKSPKPTISEPLFDKGCAKITWTFLIRPPPIVTMFHIVWRSEGMSVCKEAVKSQCNLKTCCIFYLLFNNRNKHCFPFSCHGCCDLGKWTGWTVRSESQEKGDFWAPMTEKMCLVKAGVREDI